MEKLAGGLIPVRLRCEYLDNPLGIDHGKPRLSWSLASTTPRQHQKAYRILVAGSPKTLAEGKVRCLALVYAGDNAVEKIRGILGPTDPSKAEPGSVRKEFGTNIMVNAAHASDSLENAKREIGIIKVADDTVQRWYNKYFK